MRTYRIPYLLVAVTLTLTLTLVGASCTRGDQAGVEQAPPFAGSPDPKRLVHLAGCTNCHDLQNRLVGPSFQEIAGRYQSAPEQAEDAMVKSILEGSALKWGERSIMPPQKKLEAKDLRRISRWILSLTPPEK